MSVTEADVQVVNEISLPPHWSLDLKGRSLICSHLAFERNDSSCRASVLQTYRGNVSRLQVVLHSGETVLIETQQRAVDLFEANDFILSCDDLTIADGQLCPLKKVQWVKHPFLPNGAPNDIYRLARESWHDSPSFVEETRNSSQQILRRGLRPPQKGALHAVAAHWSVSAKPGVVVMPTGTGKTEVMLACMLMRQPVRLLVLVPSDALRRQTYVKFCHLGLLYELGAIPASALRPVVGRLEQAPSTEDLPVIRSCNVVVSTVAVLQGMPNEQLRTFLSEFDTVFFDEAHHVPAQSWERVFENLGNQRVLQFTATPFRLDGRRIPGRIVYNFPLRLAQEQGYFKTIRFSEAFALDAATADLQIADLAVSRLREDLSSGFNHILLARAETTQRAEQLFNEIYLPRYPEFSPVLIHSKVKGHKRLLEAVKSGQHKIVICVDMFGEGVDVPSLKIAALHDPYRSLGITLQFTGRFTRDANGIGQATVVANIADPRVSDAVEDLCAEDSDWNEIIPELSSRAIQSQVDFSDFLAAMERSTKGDEELFDLNVLRPKTSTVIFRTRTFSPAKFRKAVKKNSTVEREWRSRDKDLLIFVTRSKCQIEWATIREATDEIWNIYVLAFDEQKELLFIHSSQKGTLHHELAKAVGGEDAMLISGEKMFRVFSGLNRLIFHNIGLYNRGTRLRFRMYTGLDVGEAINPAVQAGATKSNLFAVGYDSGERISVGASDKGRIWSMSSSSIPDWRAWCQRVASKILDDSISASAFLTHTLIPKEASYLPAKELLSACFPIEWYSCEMEHASLIEDGEIRSLHSLGISKCYVADARCVMLEIGFEGGAPVTFKLSWGPREGQFTVDRVAGTRISVRAAGDELNLEEFFREHPPTVFFVDGSELTGPRMLEAGQTLEHTFDLDRIIVADWSGVDIRVESKWKTGVCRPQSIQAKLLNTLTLQDNMVVFDDDDAGEVADIVEIVDRGNEVICRFYHCKYSGGDDAGRRVNDLYEVCGQAVRSVRWTTDPNHLLGHLLDREKPDLLNGRGTRFEKGDVRCLVNLKKRLRKVRFHYEFFVVQPGIAKSTITPALSAVLGAANAFVLDTTGSHLTLLASG